MTEKIIFKDRRPTPLSSDLLQHSTTHVHSVLSCPANCLRQGESRQGASLALCLNDWQPHAPLNHTMIRLTSTHPFGSYFAAMFRFLGSLEGASREPTYGSLQLARVVKNSLKYLEWCLVGEVGQLARTRLSLLASLLLPHWRKKWPSCSLRGVLGTPSYR